MASKKSKIYIQSAPVDPSEIYRKSAEAMRHAIYAGRTEADREGFFADIRNWRDNLPEGNTKHHVGQFEKFCNHAYERLIQDYDHATEEDETNFKSRVIGALTAQWGLLRQVAAQRLEGSPYRDELVELDLEAAQYYQAVFEALPKQSRQSLALSPPLIYLGRLAELTFFNDQNQTAPALISIPFGAIYDPPYSRGRLAIAHEVGHAVFNRMPAFMPELTEKVQAALAQDRSRSSRRIRVVHETIINWLGEIVADLVGIALAGPKFGKSALAVLALPEAVVGVTDDVHPVAIIRPYIDLTVLEFLTKNIEFGEAYLTEFAELKKLVKSFSEPYLKRRLESIPALTLITLEQVRDEMTKMIEFAVESKLAVLKNQKEEDQSLGTVLIACAENARSLDKEIVEPPDWGQISGEEEEPFVLDLSNMLAPEYATPVSFPDWYCCITGKCPCSWW